MPDIALINPNTIEPPIAPLGLEYIAEACREQGMSVQVLDLCFESNAHAALKTRLSEDVSLVGMTLRNTDTCLMLNHRSFIEPLRDMIQTVRTVTEAPVVVGGAGFSVAPGAVLEKTGADYGIIGDGEVALAELARAAADGKSPADVAGCVWREGGVFRRNEPQWPDLSGRPGLRRDMVDIRRYFREGGQIGLETSRGCNRHCTYCVDPFSKGRRVRRRSPGAVADEIENLLARGADVYHLCDSEFNLDEAHARAVCEALIDRGLGDHIGWYGYLAPRPFSTELAQLMKRAGCDGINFGADSGSDAMLRRLGRSFTRADVISDVAACREAGITVMLDLLIGAPKETPETAAESIDMVKQADPDCAGISLGVRLYPGTAVTAQLREEGPLHATEGIISDNDSETDHMLTPVFYISPDLGNSDEAIGLLDEYIAGDERFFFGGSEDDRDYNYDQNAVLVEAIADGARGAYWDILRRLKLGEL